ncbi:MAG TPA: hypothetical protein PKM65_07960 [Spirochaetota bacterium]|nr:hypothetical protein [Spirochaetota bacterium]HNT09704.1 hypothetical protein [Spirochaetota bacterium]
MMETSSHRSPAHSSALTIAIATVAILLPLSGAALFSSVDRGRVCEDRCTQKFWTCRERAFNYEGKRGDRAIAICDTMFTNCMGRCRLYSQPKRR